MRKKYDIAFQTYMKMAGKFFVHQEISKAETLPASFYRDRHVYEELKEKVFLKSWQWIGEASNVQEPLPVFSYPGARGTSFSQAAGEIFE